MNTQKFLAGRVAALENVCVSLTLALATRQNKQRLALEIYHKSFALAAERYTRSQPGPEKDAAEKALNFTHIFFQRLIDDD